ncbi:hypothetical protein E2C01_056508 [Portunus trituberculatus]|uniref:Uncharacterized protein n=1 Tax=Portunus trituberculatus TaxID=210409 RepID=A0A5B7GXN5_PORTR|nr:hypothetical protein [Portunus trituberculatus]
MYVGCNVTYSFTQFKQLLPNLPYKPTPLRLPPLFNSRGLAGSFHLIIYYARGSQSLKPFPSSKTLCALLNIVNTCYMN